MKGKRPSPVLQFLGVGCVLVALYASALLLLRNFTGYGIEKWGQFGDSFAVLTSFFAVGAAFFAWKSYTAQREALATERERTDEASLFQTFSRVLDVLRDTRAELDTHETLPAQVAGGPRTVRPVPGIEVVGTFVELVRDEIPAAAAEEAHLAKMTGESPRPVDPAMVFKNQCDARPVLKKLARVFCACVAWLDLSRGSLPPDRAAPLVSVLGASFTKRERQFFAWGLAAYATAAEREAAQRLGISAVLDAE